MANNVTYKQIEAALRAAAQLLPEDCPAGAPKFELVFGTFKVRCLPKKSAAEAVADKFKRGGRLVGPGYKPYCPRRAWRELKVVGPYKVKL